MDDVATCTGLHSGHIYYCAAHLSHPWTTSFRSRRAYILALIHHSVCSDTVHSLCIRQCRYLKQNLSPSFSAERVLLTGRNARSMCRWFPIPSDKEQHIQRPRKKLQRVSAVWFEFVCGVHVTTSFSVRTRRWHVTISCQPDGRRHSQFDLGRVAI